MFPRHISKALRLAAAQNPVVTLTGPRQSGKTTLVRALFPEYSYFSLEAPDVRSRAIEDPRGFLSGGSKIILDEVQRAPDLLSYIQGLVDEDPTPGRFILTGSQNLLLMKSVSQTLAGRTALLRLYPLSIAELTGRALFDPAQLTDSQSTPGLDRWRTLFKGFYPRVHDTGVPARAWLADYFRTYVERDVRAVLDVSDTRAFENFVRLAAANTAQELNLTRLASDVGVTQQTARRWLNALEIGYLAITLPPHYINYRKRLRKRPRLHFLDSGLTCYLLGITDAEILAGHPLRGAIFESYVISEIIKSFINQRRDPPLFFWRDATGHEIDTLIDLGERILPVEVKSGETVPADAVLGLQWWTSLPTNPNTGGLLVHGGNERFSLRGFEVLPWFLA
ncbi:MAG: ATP-binding protein [Gammaproteobacteria bacterium]|nr:ATP-binding protein [Gammaproteobacteria bacterium]